MFLITCTFGQGKGTGERVFRVHLTYRLNLGYHSTQIGKDKEYEEIFMLSIQKLSK